MNTNPYRTVIEVKLLSSDKIFINLMIHGNFYLHTKDKKIEKIKIIARRLSSYEDFRLQRRPPRPHGPRIVQFFELKKCP